MNNIILNKVKNSSNNDEFYTPYGLIEKELKHYKSQFKNKIVFCNCNDFNSEFTNYFMTNFNDLKLYRLISISFSNNRGRKFEFNGYEKTESDLYFTGDFRDIDCIKLLKDCDIVVTNPPFSLFRELFSLLMKYNKKFLIIGNQNVLLYKEVFPYIMKDEVRLGYEFGEMQFKVPEDTEPRNSRFWIDESGQKWKSIGNGIWLTNLRLDRSFFKLNLTKEYIPEDYSKYDNYEAIHIDKVKNIPKDYQGLMAVPLTYLKFHDNSQFEIVGEANHGSDNEFDLFKPILNGKEVFKRVIIKRR